MNTSTLNILKNFSSINNEMRIDEGSTIAIYNKELSVYAMAELQDDSFPKQFGIYDLGRWLNTLNMFKGTEYTIDYQDTHMGISYDKMRIKYRYSDLSIINQPNNAPKITDEPLFSFDLIVYQLQSILKASSILGTTILVIDPKKMKQISPNDRGESIDNEYSLELENVEINGDENVQGIIKIQSLKLLQLDYRVEVYDKLVFFKSKDENTNVSYFVGTIKFKS